jgi:hypothetical protein
MISRSNWAKDKRMLRVSRPMESPELKCWVTLAKVTWCFSKVCISLAKSIRERERRSTL